jgi:hypothetical protein
MFKHMFYIMQIKQFPVQPTESAYARTRVIQRRNAEGFNMNYNNEKPRDEIDFVRDIRSASGILFNRTHRQSDSDKPLIASRNAEACHPPARPPPRLM